MVWSHCSTLPPSTFIHAVGPQVSRSPSSWNHFPTRISPSWLLRTVAAPLVCGFCPGGLSHCINDQMLMLGFRDYSSSDYYARSRLCAAIQSDLGGYDCKFMAKLTRSFSYHL